MTAPRSRTFPRALAFAAICSLALPALAIDDLRDPRLHRASEQLDNASDALHGDTRPESDYSGHRARALELIRQAKSELELAAQAADNPPPPPAPQAQLFNDQPSYDQANGNDSTYSQDSFIRTDDHPGGYGQPGYSEEPVYTDPPPSYIPPPAPVVYYNAPPPPSPVGYWGHHPIPGGGWCLAEGPHPHNYEPEFYDQFHFVDGYFKFGEGFAAWGYAGEHPIPGGGWCSINGYHRHEYRPEVGFIFDPVRRGYYYDRERAVVIRTEVIVPPPNYRPPSVVVEHYNHPPPIHPAPIGTPPPQPWRQEHVLAMPHPAGQPQQFHPQNQQPMPYHPSASSPPNQMPGFHQAAAPGPVEHPAPAPMAHPQQPPPHPAPPRPPIKEQEKKAEER